VAPRLPCSREACPEEEQRRGLRRRGGCDRGKYHPDSAGYEPVAASGYPCDRESTSAADRLGEDRSRVSDIGEQRHESGSAEWRPERTEASRAASGRRPVHGEGIGGDLKGRRGEPAQRPSVDRDASGRGKRRRGHSVRPGEVHRADGKAVQEPVGDTRIPLRTECGEATASQQIEVSKTEVTLEHAAETQTAQRQCDRISRGRNRRTQPNHQKAHECSPHANLLATTVRLSRSSVDGDVNYSIPTKPRNRRERHAATRPVPRSNSDAGSGVGETLAEEKS